MEWLNKEKEVAALSAVLAFFVMHTTINSLLIFDGIIQDGKIVKEVIDGSISSVCGIQSLELGVFGGILVGLGVGYLHNHFYQIQLPKFLSFLKANALFQLFVALLISLLES